VRCGLNFSFSGLRIKKLDRRTLLPYQQHTPGWVFKPAGEGLLDDKDFTLTPTDTPAIAAAEKWLKDSGYTGGGWGCPESSPPYP
jgi:hypothetical protein